MLISRKDRQLIDYQNSYFSRKQRKKQRYKWMKYSLLLILIIVLSLVLSPLVQSMPLHVEKAIKPDNALIQGPQLLFTDPNQQQAPNTAMPASYPVDIEANIEINGLVAYAEIKQTFINPHSIALEGKYQFPLPENAAVKHLKIKMADKEIIGEIMEKKAAKKIYQKAKRQGRKTSLVEQHRPNIFTNKIANIPAQSTVVVTLKLIMPVSFSQGKFNLRLPLALTQRYQPKSNTQLSNVAEHSTNNLGEHTQQLLSEPFKRATDNTFYNLASRVVARSQSSLNILLNSGIAITDIVSSSHRIKSRQLNSQQNTYLITLNKSHVISDKSFELSWQLLASSQPQVSSFTQEVADEHYTLLTFFPPKTEAAKVIARDLIFIIDTSGSMQGGSMAQAKTSLQHALLQLNPKDSFNIIAFDNDTQLLFPITQMASSHNIVKAQQFISNLSADGGTEMYRPLSNALMMKKNNMQSKKAIRQIVFITDGAVSNEFELMQLLNTAQGDFRLYTVGIGAAPNGYFMKKAAQFGRGSYVFIQNNHEVQQKMTHFMTKISQPAISDIKLTLDGQAHQHVDIYPKKIPDLYFGEPLQVAIKSHHPIASIQLNAQTSSSPWYQQLIINDSPSSKGISTLWARRKIESLLDSLIVGADKNKVKSQVINTSLTHQIISPYTSFIAVEKEAETPPLIAKNNLSLMKKSANSKDKSNAMQAHESLMVAMPQTALGWQLQFLIGITLLLSGLIFSKVSNFTYRINHYLKMLICYDKHH